MKRINYIFYTGVAIIIFLIVSPIYWQYEVNEFHDAAYFYKISNFEGETVAESYRVLEDGSGTDANTFYIVRPASADNVDLIEDKYCFNYNDKPNNYTVESAIKFSTNCSDLTSFSQSNGYFYSDIPFEELNAMFSDNGLSLTETQDIYENDLSRFLYDNLFPILVVIFFTFIISIILTLKDVKEVAILSLHGVPDLSVKLRLTCRTFQGLLKTVLAIFLAFTIYKLLQGNYLSLVFFKFYFIVILAILTVYTIVYFLALVATSSVDIINVLKNKDYSLPVYISLLIIQAFVIILVPILFSNYISNYDNVKNTKNEISRVFELENYYTYYGVNANFYDSLSDEDLSMINEDFKALYNDNIDTSYYFEPVFTQYLERYGESINQMPIENIIFMDDNYYNYIAHFNKRPVNEIKNDTLLIPFSFKDYTNKIIESLALNNKDIEIIYIDDNIEIYFDDFNSEYDLSSNVDTFSKRGINNVIVITSPNNLQNTNPYANTIYIDKMTNGSIFFKENSLQSMMDITQKYNIDKLVTPESKLSPYNNLLYNLEYTYKIITYTLALTLISVLIINTFAAEIIISRKKKLIAIGFLNGKNILFSMKNNFILYSIISIVSVCVMYLMNKFTVEILLVIIVLYLYICLYLALKYLDFVNNKILTLLKGE